MEALIGAIYLDGGLLVQRVHSKIYLSDLENKKLFYDSKTILQEMVQAKFTENVRYVLEKEEGPDHNKSFTTSAYIGEECYGTGSGRTKKSFLSRRAAISDDFDAEKERTVGGRCI